MNEYKFKFEFFIEAKSCPRPRLSKGHTYMPKQYQNFKKALQGMAKKRVAQIQLKEPLINPIKIRVDFYFKTPKSWSKKKAENAFYHSSKPDLDNLVKSVLDAFNGIVFKDDAQVVEIIARKFWSDRESYITTCVEILEDKNA